MTAAFDLTVAVDPDVTLKLDNVRKAIGCLDHAAFWMATVPEITRASMRSEYCGRHGGLRVSTCCVCKRLGQ